MGGPAFSLSSNVNLELTFDNMEEVKKHPMASQALITIDQLLQAVHGMSRDEVLNYIPQFEGADQDKLNAHIAQNEYCKDKKMGIDVMQLIGEMIGDMDPACKINARINVYDIGSGELTIEGAGYGQIVNLVFRAITYGFKKDYQDKILADFNAAQTTTDAPKDMEMMPEPMGMPMEEMM